MAEEDKEKVVSAVNKKWRPVQDSRNHGRWCDCTDCNVAERLIEETRNHGRWCDCEMCRLADW